MEKIVNNSVDSIVDGLLKEVPTESEITLELPSKSFGYSYKGPVVLKPMRLGDELAIASAKKGKSNPINVLLSRVLPNIDPNELFLIDKIYILLKLREISSGDTISSVISCSHCDTINEINIKIPDLPIEFLPEDFKDPREITLPLCKKKVTIRTPRGRDEIFMTDHETILKNLWKFVTKVEEYTDAKVIEAFLARLKNKDYGFLIKELMLNDYGIQSSIKFKCSNCEKVNVTRLPIGNDFLSEN